MPEQSQERLHFMNEDEFVNASPEQSQRWQFRILVGICQDVKVVKAELANQKKKNLFWKNAHNFAGGIVGGFVAFFTALKLKLIGTIQ